MPSPVYSAGAPGGLINGLSVAKQTTIAAFLDLSAAFEGQVTCEMTTGASAPTAATTFSAYKVYGNGSANTLSAASSGATSISCSSSSGLHQGQKIALQQSGTAPQVGEVVTITGAITGSGPYTVPCSALVNTYTGGSVYLIAQTPTASVSPTSSAGTWAATTDYSGVLLLGAGQWVVAANNTDGTQAVTVTASVDRITAYQ